jgi:peptide/nickel transport system substrate-binding protein
MYHTSLAGAEVVDPTNKFMRANGETVATGWPSSQEVESEVSAWFDAKTAEEEKIVARRLNRVALEHVVCVPLGSYLNHHA